MTDIIPSKRFFKIGEVSRIVGVPTHVLRYWEREFSLVVETLLHIKNLLHDEKYTIAGARKKLKLPSDHSSHHPTLDEIKQELIPLRPPL
jgi:DNA-binding transcriptional MerR regulator